MSATASLMQTVLAVEPGGEATMELRVRNSGTVVDELQFAVVGDAAPWAVVEPPSVSLFPQDEATVLVRFQPPRSPAPPAGPMPFAVAVTCREDAMGGVAEEGTIEVLPVTGVTLELLPSVNRGSRGATYQIAIDNRGNTPVESNIAFVDTTEQLKGIVELQVVRSEPGWASFTELKVRPRKRFWKGAAQSKPFQVTLDTQGEFTTVGGSFLQEPLLPKWLGKALLALAALAVVMLALWLLFMKPFVESAAEDAAKKEAAAATQAANEAKQEAAAAGAAAQQAKDKVDQATTGTTAPPVVTAPAPAPAAVPPAPTLQSFRLGDGPTTFTVPDGKNLLVTDMLFSNPSGSTGTIQLVNNGAVVVKMNLENFRDKDHHVGTPIEVKSGQTLSLVTDCSGCDAAVFISGELK